MTRAAQAAATRASLQPISGLKQLDRGKGIRREDGVVASADRAIVEARVEGGGALEAEVLAPAGCVSEGGKGDHSANSQAGEEQWLCQPSARGS